MAKILVIRDEEHERLQHYAKPEYGSGGFQNLCRKLLARIVPHSDDVDDYIKLREKEEKGLFG